MRNICFILATLLMLCAFASCGKGTTAPQNAATDNNTPAPVENTVQETPEVTPEPEKAPEETPAEEVEEVTETDVHAQSVVITTDNDGEENQHVNFTFTFDGTVGTVLASDFYATIVGNEVEPERMSVVSDGDTVTLTLRPDAIKAGMIELEYNGTGVHPFALHSIVSPGMHLETVSQDKDNATVTVKVSELYHVRGIGRVQLIENGEVVKTQGEEPSVFTGIHGHNFLELDENMIAEKIVFGLTESFPEGYEFTNDGDTVTVKKLNADGPVELNLTVQEKAEIEQK